MGIDTKIEWCHHTFNPWWGCVRVSPGCEHCYAEAFDKRVGRSDWGVRAERRLFGDKHWAEPLKWNRDAIAAGERRRVFCASMADVFEDRRDLHDQRARLWGLIEETPGLDWLLLTKRPENHELVPFAWQTGSRRPENLWFGTTCEDQQRFNERVLHLRAATWPTVRFLSMEPLLGPIFGDFLGIDWAIIGGESGGGSRPFDLDWPRRMIPSLRESGAAVFVKQLGDASVWPLAEAARASFRSGRIRLKPKGGDMSEWPSDLRIREFPATSSPGAREGDATPDELLPEPASPVMPAEEET